MSQLGGRGLGCGFGGIRGVWWGRLGCRLFCEVGKIGIGVLFVGGV